MPGYTLGMQEDSGWAPSRVEEPDRETSGIESTADLDHPVIERICKMGFTVLVTGICLQALAAAIALAVAISMVVLGVTGGLGLWAIIVASAVVVGVCAAAMVCRIRARRSGPQS